MRRIAWRPLLPVLSSMLLAACAVTPSQNSHSTIASKPLPTFKVPVTVQPLNGPATAPVSETSATGSAQSSDTWQQLRDSFAMSDCDADPSILALARQYTKDPAHFEDQVRLALPQLAYVQEVASHYDVAGEFVFLPWIESGFQSVPGRRNRPAGMWQIMPLTADHMGLRVDGRYDARLDIDASANAVMKLLKQYHDRFGDWRVVDYAYNVGEFNIARLIEKKGMPPAEPVVPRWPVKSVTREHLTRLLAMACVVREPDRFNVSLPTLTDDKHLVQVNVPQSMAVTQAASNAGLSVGALKNTNAAIRSNTIDASKSSYLLLPADHAQQFRDSLLQQNTANAGSDQPAVVTDDSTKETDAHRTKPPSDAHRKTHTVTSGESLWQIAHRYSLSTKKLEQWNNLHGQKLKPGQILKLSGDR